MPAEGGQTLEVRTVSTNDAVHLSLSGELDLASADKLERELESAEPGANVLVLDLRELSFIDSSGLRLVLVAAKRAGEAGRRLVLVRGPREVDRVFQVTGTSEQLEFIEDPAEVTGSK